MEKTKRIALISVYDKTGIVEFARNLVFLLGNWEIVSSGGTAKHLQEAGIPVTDVATLVGGEAILGHRVVTLSREVHAGLLAQYNDKDSAELASLNIPYIDLVCVDLYPLEAAIKDPNATTESVIEKTDIGGPTMIRSAAKGRRIVICDPEDRTFVIEWLKDGEPEREKVLNNLAAKAESIIARYCSLSAEFHSKGMYKHLSLVRSRDCSYGENAWQAPAYVYKTVGSDDPLALHKWQPIAGNPPSYNNWCDIDRLIQTMTHIGAGFEKNFTEVPAIALGVKHGNACGAAYSEDKDEATEGMLRGDQRAIFGGSVMLNFQVDEAVANILMSQSNSDKKRILDVVAAPSFTPLAVDTLTRKSGKCRLIANPHIERAGIASLDTAARYRYVRGGFLEQPNYTFVQNLHDKNAVLAWAVGSTSNSNTITIVKDGRLYGNGVGQQDRVGAAKLAIFRADEAARSAGMHPTADLRGAVAYSDSFFPFTDAIEVLINRGIETILATLGSMNDSQIIRFCEAKHVKFVTLPDAEARGFYAH